MLQLSDDEALELYRFTRNDYINVNTYPALLRLLTRVEKRVKEIDAPSDIYRNRSRGALGVSPGGTAPGLDCQ